MTDCVIRARLDDPGALRISSSSGAGVLKAHFAPCVLDLLGRARPQARAAMQSVI
jgi:hypothetical protein